MANVVMKHRTYVKPDVDGWLTVHMTLPEAFVDDWKRYSLWIALYNLFYVLKTT